MGIDFTPSNSVVTVNGCHFRDFNTNSAASVIKINSMGADFEISECVFDNLATAMPYAGIEVNAVQDLMIADCNIIHCGIDLCIEPPAGSTVASVWANNTFFDTATYGIRISDKNGGNVVRCRFEACWASSHTQYGVYIDTSGSGTVDGITFIDLHAYLNGQDGLRCNGENITIEGGIFANNMQAGISLASGSDSVYILGVKSGAFSGLAGNKHGLFVGTGCTHIDILDNRFDANTTSSVLNGSDSSPSLRVARNIGYKTFAKGQATIPAGSTSVVVYHGLDMAPSSTEVMLS